MAGRAPQSENVPGISDVRSLAPEKHGAVDRIAACIAARLIGRFENRRMPAHPGCVGTSARKAPFAGHAITTVNGERLGNARRRPPSNQCVGCAKDFASNFRLQKSGGMRGDSRLCKAPGRARIRCRKCLDDLVESDEIDAAAT